MKKVLVYLICIFNMATVAAYAEEARETKGEIPIRIRANGQYIGSSDFSDGGSASVTSTQLGVEAAGFSFRYGADMYSWDETGSLPFGDGDEPWGTLHKIRLGYTYRDQINKNWGYLLSASINSAFEEEMSGSYGGALRAGLNYKFNENWSAMFGVGTFMNSIETSLMPFAGLSYQDFAKDGSGVFMNLGAPSSEVGYAFDKESKLRAAFNMQGDTYRLSDDSSVAEEGYVSTSGMMLGLYYDWKPTDALSFSFGPEYHFNRDIQIYDADGDEVGDEHSQGNALGGSFKFSYMF